MTDDWIVVETLAPHGPYTVIADGGRRKSWATLVRARSEFGSVAANRVVNIVRDCVRTGAAQDDRVVPKRGAMPLRVRGIPVLNASGEVHAVHVWVGAHESEPPPRRIVAAWDWDAETELAH